jgi:glutamate dehydrogenase (NADP+)
MLKNAGKDIKGARIALSGFGNVAWGAALKATELGAKVVCISGPDGYIYDEEGIAGEKIAYMDTLLQTRNNVVAPFAEKYKSAKFFAGQKPWNCANIDIAMPCAIQNELNADDARILIKNGVYCVGEISNMGCTAEAVHELQKAKVMFCPGKAANAGGVAVSGLEMCQNAGHISWTAEQVDEKLFQIMKDIHENCIKYGTEQGGYVNYVKGANIAGFIKVADAMLALGIV